MFLLGIVLGGPIMVDSFWNESWWSRGGMSSDPGEVLALLRMALLAMLESWLCRRTGELVAPAEQLLSRPLSSRGIQKQRAVRCKREPSFWL